MRKFASSGLARTAAALLFLACGALCVFYSFLWGYTALSDEYEKASVSFEESWLCEQIFEKYAARFWPECFSYGPGDLSDVNPERLDARSGFLPSGVGVRITKDGQVLYDNGVSGTPLPFSYGSEDGAVLSFSLGAFPRTSSVGVAAELYRIGSERKTSAAPLSILSFAGACLFYVLFCSGAGRKNGERHLSYFGKISFLFELILCLIPFGLGILFLYLADAAYDILSLYAGVYLALVSVLFFLLFVLLLSGAVCERAKNGVLWKNSLLAKLFHGLRCAFRLLGRFFYRFPVFWSRILLVAVWVFFLLVMHADRFETWLITILFFLFSAAAVGYFLFEAARLRDYADCAQSIAEGTLSRSVDSRCCFGDMKRLGRQLNLSLDAVNRAVEERMKSERLKTELITNVSHDVKTPLTSIIGYVDLLKKEELPTENAREYLEIVDRQANRLKVMLADLMEASKASSGNLAPEFSENDLKELLLQTVGEYEDRFRSVRLTPVTRLPEDPVPVETDGTMVWRCVSNLLSNAVKYSAPDSRVYIDLERSGGKAVMTFRNISKAPLNISPDELTERFVRGDRSRTDEGSGLGLSIVKSFAELLGGDFRILIDGDYFKAVLSLPEKRMGSQPKE